MRAIDAVIPYTNVTLDQVADLVQDAIFSRPPKDGAKTCVFIGGKNAHRRAGHAGQREKGDGAAVRHFAVRRSGGIVHDGGGDGGAAGADVADYRTTAHWPARGSSVFGATGVVGFASAVISALEGAHVTLVGHDGAQRVREAADEAKVRFGVSMNAADGSTEELKAALLHGADVALCAGKAGVQIIDADLLKAIRGLLAVADVNAVPPLGVAGLDLFSDGATIDEGGTAGIGALAIGQTKYQTEFGLFRRLIESSKPLTLDFRDAFVLARELSK